MYKKTRDFFSIAGGLEIGATCWNLQQETGDRSEWAGSKPDFPLRLALSNF